MTLRDYVLSPVNFGLNQKYDFCMLILQDCTRTERKVKIHYIIEKFF